MTTNNQQCVLCGGRLENGFLVDATHGGRTNAKWHPGEPQPSFWTGLKVTAVLMKPITAMRCDRCGRLELFAP